MNHNMLDLTGRVALVTGASRGIGRACALRLAEAGADVVVNYLTSTRAAEEVAEAIVSLGRQAAVIKADVSQADDVQAMLEFVREQFGRLDILLSNAASGGFRQLADASHTNFEAAMNTNVRAFIDLMQAALPLLERTEGRAKVIVLSSHGSHRALPQYGLIGGSKAALASIARHFALELGNRGVNVNIVEAGLVATDSTRHLPGAQQLLAARGQYTLVGDRLLEARDVADAVLFLSSPLSDLVQGQTLVIDGGASIRA
jgi:enoyl-[acyl-carrier protein] reductase III